MHRPKIGLLKIKHVKNHRIKLIVFLILITILSCKKEKVCQTELKFNKELWLKNNKTDCYRDREKMLDDLLESGKLKGLKYSEIIDLLGKSEIETSSHSMNISYTITTKNDSTISTKKYKELIIGLNNDSIAIGVIVANHSK